MLNLSGFYRHGARAALEGSLTKERAAHAATIEVKESAEDTVAKQAAEIAALEAQSREDAKLRRKLHNTIQELKGRKPVLYQCFS
eukprot:COSAG05_NODE_73_length_21807_cov_283.593698_23_plen_85_part_00